MTTLLAALLLCAAIDGDTLSCGHERVRVMGVDTPEVAAQCEAERIKALEASFRTAVLIAGGVTLERHGVDRYGRRLARVWLPDGRELAAVLIAEGLGRRYNGGHREGWCG